MLLAFLVSTMFAASRTASPRTCNEPTENEWLTARSAVSAQTFSAKKFTLPSNRILIVESDLEEAVARLQKPTVIPLKAREVRKFTGRSFEYAGRANLKPYLVRAVFPTSNPRISVTGYGEVTEVAAAGLGCHPYLKHPLVLFLKHPLQKLIVSAHAAM